MALYLPETDALILEVTKTGSKWVRSAVANAQVRHQQVGPPGLRGHGDLALHGRGFRFIACFVRHPLSWYRSYWAYRTERGWRPRFNLDRLCRSDDLVTFVRNAATRLPGMLTAHYEAYAGPETDPIHFVGRQERLADDLVMALRLAGERFDEERLRATPPVNTTSIKPEVGDEIEELLAISEFDAERRFGYLGSDDPLRLRDLAARFPDDFGQLRRLALWTASIHWQFDDQRAAAGTPAPAGRRHARTLCNFALYMQHVKGDLEEAEALLRQAMSAAPYHPRTLGTFALFLEQVRQDYDAAERHYRAALEVRGDHAYNLGNFAVFMKNVRQDHDAAETLYRKAIEAAPGSAQTLANFALFMKNVRRDYDAAEALYRRSLAADPRNSRHLGNFAVFMEQVRQDSDAAEALYRQALESDPDNLHNLSNYALFLERVRYDRLEAQRLLRRALALAPADPRLRARLERLAGAAPARAGGAVDLETAGP